MKQFFAIQSTFQNPDGSEVREFWNGERFQSSRFDLMLFATEQLANAHAKGIGRRTDSQVSVMRVTDSDVRSL